MNAEIAKKEETRLARPLKVLVPLIRTEIEAGEAAGLEHYRAAGEMLQEAKGQIEHGRFETWFDKQGFAWSIRTARRYMALADVVENGRPGRFARGETLESAIGETRTPRIAEPTYHQPVTRVLQAVDTSALAREEQGRREEQRLVRELGLQLVKIGYRILAEKLHPDKSGGSTEAMARLNRVRSILEGALK